MNWRNTQDRYGSIAQALHWLTVLLLIGMFGVGFYMHELPVSPLRLRLYSYHKWAGVTLFALIALRLAWRLWTPPPPLPAGVAAWEQRVALLTHRLLYLLLFAVPLSGWLMSSAKGFQTVWFGVLPIPDLLDKNPALGEALEDVHWGLNKTLLGVALLHILAALKHYWIDRDDVLQRMVPGLKSSTRMDAA